MPRAVLLSATLALTLACHAARPTDASAWLELESPHFTVRTDLAEGSARVYVIELEHMRDALFLGSWHGDAPPPGRMTILLVADQGEAAEFMSSHFAGLTTQDLFGEPIMLLSAAQSPSQLDVLKHELAHWLDSAYLQRMPRWLNEGLACYLQTARTDSTNGTVVVGEPDRARALRARDYAIDYSRILATRGAIGDESEDDLANFYAGAWALVHYLADEERPRFTDYLHRLARAEEPSAAYAAVFPELQGQELAKRLHQYLQRGRLGVGRLQVPEWRGEISVRPLGAAELRAQRASLLLIGFGMKHDQQLRSRVRAEAEAALAIDPAHPLALAVLFALEAGQPATRLERARESAKAHPDDPRALLLLSDQLDNSPANTAEKRAVIERTVALEPESARALINLASIDLADNRAAEALPIALHAVKNDPAKAGGLMALAAAYAKNGLCAESAIAAERAFEVLPDRAPQSLLKHLRRRGAALAQECPAP